MKPSINPKYTSVGVCAFKFNLALAKVPETSSTLITTTIVTTLDHYFITLSNKKCCLLYCITIRY